MLLPKPLALLLLLSCLLLAGCLMPPWEEREWDGIAPDMVHLLGGSFEMGCTASSGCNSDELPTHSVTLTRNFWLGETEVTKDEYHALLGSHHWDFGEPEGAYPMDDVGWLDALVFADALSTADGLEPCYGTGVDLAPGTGTLGQFVNSSSGSVYDCEGYRLPTEAEWEFAARAGTDLPYSGSEIIDNVAWYAGNSSVPHPVATKAANTWGLYDMSGNVREWTWDGYRGWYSSETAVVDPEEPSESGLGRVLRGGGVRDGTNHARVYARLYAPDEDFGQLNINLGFRLARTAP